MTLYINARFLTQPITGVQRYAIEVSKRLRDTDLNPVFLAPKNILHTQLAQQLGAKQVGTLTGHLWEQLELPLFARDGLLLSLCNTGPLLKRRQVVTMHDAAVYSFPEAYSFLFRSWYKVLFPVLGKQARQVITVSQFSKQELMTHCRIAEQKLRVTYEGAEHILATPADVAVLDAHGLRDKPYVFAVSSLNPSKNFKTFIRAAEILGEREYQFVVAGGSNPKVFQSSDLSLPANVTYLGYVSDGELRALYENARCYVHPSLYEGFGLTPLEALKCGCPTIAARSSCLPEILGNAVMYCNPNDPDDLANTLQTLMSNPQEQQRLRTYGLEYVRRFSWSRCVAETRGILEQVMV